MGKSHSFGQRELKDSILIEKVMATAAMEARKPPELEEITTESGYRVIRAKTDGPGVFERKVYKPGHCLNPEE